MSEATRKKLSLGQVREGLVDESEDGPLPLVTLDLALPCRSFVVDHKVADVGMVSVTAEFLLRFIRSMGRCTEEAAQSFFGYNRREMAYVLHEVEDADYIVRSDGRISLTSTGASLFQIGVEEPLIYEVERKSARVAFDLISLAPAEKKFLTFFERSLPELPLREPKQVSNAAELVPISFRRFFREIASKIDPTATQRRSLYSIDSVSPDERFSTLVRVRLMSTGLRPSIAEIDLSDWKSEYELSDREAVARAVADLIEGLSIQRRSDDEEAYSLLLYLAPEYLKEFTRKDGLNISRFYRHAFTSRGGVSSSWQTTPVVGSLFTQENARRLVEVANYGFRRTRRGSAALYWVIPQVPLWGSTSVLKEEVDRFRDLIALKNEDLKFPGQVQTVSLTAVRADRWIKEAFGLNLVSDGRVFPGGFEMLLVPGVFVAATIHATIGQSSGLPVPLGFASFDERIVARATQLLDENAEKFGFPGQLLQDVTTGLMPKDDATASAEPEG